MFMQLCSNLHVITFERISWSYSPFMVTVMIPFLNELSITFVNKFVDYELHKPLLLRCNFTTFLKVPSINLVT